MYHIFYRPKGQKGSSLLSYNPPDSRESWEQMANRANRTGSMRHPETGAALEFASLQYGGQNGQGGMLCQKWDAEEGLKKVFEPEPNRGIVEVPEQPPPPIPELEAFFAETEPIVQENDSFSELEQ